MIASLGSSFGHFSCMHPGWWSNRSVAVQLTWITPDLDSFCHCMESIILIQFSGKLIWSSCWEAGLLSSTANRNRSAKWSFRMNTSEPCFDGLCYVYAARYDLQIQQSRWWRSIEEQLPFHTRPVPAFPPGAIRAWSSCENQTSRLDMNWTLVSAMLKCFINNCNWLWHSNMQLRLLAKNLYRKQHHEACLAVLSARDRRKHCFKVTWSHILY